MVATSQEFDIPSVFSRGISGLRKLSKVWTDSFSMHPQSRAKMDLPWKIIYPVDFFPLSNSGQDQAIRDFVDLLASHLECEAEKVSLRNVWSSSPPADESDMDVYMKNVK